MRHFISPAVGALPVLIAVGLAGCSPEDQYKKVDRLVIHAQVVEGTRPLALQGAIVHAVIRNRVSGTIINQEKASGLDIRGEAEFVFHLEPSEVDAIRNFELLDLHVQADHREANGRLVGAPWTEDTNSGDPYAPYAYHVRALFDLEDPDVPITTELAKLYLRSLGSVTAAARDGAERESGRRGKDLDETDAVAILEPGTGAAAAGE